MVPVAERQGQRYTDREEKAVQNIRAHKFQLRKSLSVNMRNFAVFSQWDAKEIFFSSPSLALSFSFFALTEPRFIHAFLRGRLIYVPSFISEPSLSWSAQFKFLTLCAVSLFSDESLTSLFWEPCLSSKRMSSSSSYYSILYKCMQDRQVHEYYTLLAYFHTQRLAIES